MQSAKSFLVGVPFLALVATFGCSDGAAEGDVPIGSGGSVATAGNGGAAMASAGTSTATAGGANVAGAMASGGAPPGASGTGTGGGPSQGGTGGGSVGQAGSAPAGGGGGGGGSAVVPTDGKGLYDANCKLCHNEQGTGSSLGPAIVHPVRDYSTWVVRNGRPLLAPWAKAMEKLGTDKLSDAQLNLIWSYLDEPPQPTTGAALYADYCANCHGADGTGGPTMRKLAGEGKNVLKLVREGKSVGQYAMRHDSMPKFDTTRITAAELDLILAHVNTF